MAPQWFPSRYMYKWSQDGPQTPHNLIIYMYNDIFGGMGSISYMLITLFLALGRWGGLGAQHNDHREALKALLSRTIFFQKLYVYVYLYIYIAIVPMEAPPH